MVITIEYRSSGPYKSVEQMLNACGVIELPTSRFYSEQEKTTHELAQGVRIIITEHYGPILWLYPPKDCPDFDPAIAVAVSQNGEALSFPRNNADCYGINEKDILEIKSIKDNQTTSDKIIFSRLK